MMIDSAFIMTILSESDRRTSHNPGPAQKTLLAPRQRSGLAHNLLQMQTRCSTRSELHQYGQVQPVLILAKIGCPPRNRGPKRPRIASRRCNPTASCEIGNVRRAMVVFPAESYVLAGHVIVGCGHVPRLVGVTGILREIGRPRDSGRAVDRRQQYQVTAWIVYLAAAERYCVPVFMEPQAVVDHVSNKTLLGINNALPPDHLNGIAEAANATAAFAAQIAGKSKGRFVQKPPGIVVILHLDAVIRVKARTVGYSQCVGTQAVVIQDNRHPAVRAVVDLSAEPGLFVKFAVRLPTVDEPGFNFQLRRRKHLQAYTVKKPRR